MAEVFRYEVIPPSSWAYLSTILMVSLFLKFGRLFSVRNIDIILLAFLTPGLLIVQNGASARKDVEIDVSRLTQSLDAAKVRLEKLESKVGDGENGSGIPGNPAASPLGGSSPGESSLGGSPLGESIQGDALSDLKAEIDISKTAVSNLTQQLVDAGKLSNALRDRQFIGYIWLFLVGVFLMARMLIDPFMIRRPLLEPNLEFSGLTFLTIVLLLFLVVNLFAASPDQEDIIAASGGKDLATATATNQYAAQGPGYRLLFLFPVIPTFVAEDPQDETTTQQTERRGDTSLIVVSKVMAIFGQLAVVIGIYLVGYLHFNNTQMGIGIVTIYLLHPYTAEMTGRVIHILPAAALVWAVVCYRRPFWSGMFVGLAMGLAYYPLFLLPLWFSFYWHRGIRQFALGFLVMVGVLAATLIFTSSDFAHFVKNLRAMFGAWIPLMEGLNGIWEKGNIDASFRLPIIASFSCMSISFAVWPAQKNLGTLLSCSAALMIAVQFWHGFDGGLLMAWYLPLTLMTMFRPNLEDRTALSLEVPA